jgi:hypothetical protein
MSVTEGEIAVVLIFASIEAGEGVGAFVEAAVFIWWRALPLLDGSGV